MGDSKTQSLSSTPISTIPKEDKPTQVLIDNIQYTVKKFNFKQSMTYARIVSKIFKGTDIPVGLDEIKNAQGNEKKKKKLEMNLNIGDVMGVIADDVDLILAMGIGEELETVQNFQNTDQALDAVEKVMEVNSMIDVLGKFSTLLGNTMSTSKKG